MVLSSNALLPDSEDQIRLETLGGEPLEFAACPALSSVHLENRDLGSQTRGVFTEYHLPQPAAPKERIEALPVKAAVLHGTNVPNAMDESVWIDAAVWRITVPAAWRQRDTLVRIHFVGDVARLYAGGKLVADKFYNGQPFDTGLWRIPAHQLDQLEIHVMPLPAQLEGRLRENMRPKLDQNSPRAQLLKVEAFERQQLRLELKGGEPAPRQ